MSKIKEHLSLRVDAHTTSADIRRRAKAEVPDIEQKIRRLEAIHVSRTHLVKSCRGCGSAAECPIMTEAGTCGGQHLSWCRDSRQVESPEILDRIRR